MDEAERFDWLMAMDDGKIIATGTLQELLAKTGEPNLDEAFIALMPEAKRALHKKVVVRPRVVSPDETPAIEAEGLTRRFGDFVAVDHVNFRIARGEIFGFLGSNGCGKSTTMKMLTGFLPASSGSGKLFGQPDGFERHGGAAQRRLHDAGVLALRRADGRAESRTARSALSSAAGEDRSRASTICWNATI